MRVNLRLEKLPKKAPVDVLLQIHNRRLNVIIQPHLRFSYELLKWEEALQQRRGEKIKRELEWGEIAREIAAMNKPYSR